MVTLKLPLINRRTFKVELVNPVIYVIGYLPEAQQFYVWTGKNQVIPSLKIKMRALKNRSNTFKPNCVICKRKTCVDDVPKIICKINPDTSRVTRSVTRLIKSMKDFIIIEIYRCMPLLGNEEQLVPRWDVHIVHYAIVFTNVSR